MESSLFSFLPLLLASGLALAVGLAAGALLAAGFGRRATADARALARQEAEASFAAERATAGAARAELEERVRGKEATLAERERELATARAATVEAEARANAAREANARLETERAEQAKALEEKIALLTQARGELEKAFQALAGEALKSSGQSFLHLAQETLKRFQDGARTDLAERQKAIETVVAPVRESLAKVDAQVRELEVKREGAYKELSENLRQLHDQNTRLTRETTTLSTALKSSQARGRWGEIQLRRIIELAGMLEHCDFSEQESTTTEDGNRLRPDLIVRLPGGRRIVIDSKCPLAAYIRATEVATEEERQVLLLEHAAAVRKHISALGTKAYWDQFDDTVDFVVLFLPGEPFFAAAVASDANLLEVGAESGVLLASPTSLIALLKAVAYGWRQQKTAENAEKIAEEGRELYDRVCAFLNHFSKVGDGLEKAVKSYNAAVGSVETRLLPQARKFPALGIKSPSEAVDPAPIEAGIRAVHVPEQAAISSARKEDPRLFENSGGDRN